MTHNPRILFVIESINLVTTSQLFIPHRRICSFFQLPWFGIERRRDRGTGSQLSSVRSWACGVPVSSREDSRRTRPALPPSGNPPPVPTLAFKWQPPPPLLVSQLQRPFLTLATLWTQYEPQIVALLWLLLKTMKSCSSLLGDTESWPLWDQRGALWNCLKMDSFADSSLRGGGYERLSHLL